MNSTSQHYLNSTVLDAIDPVAFRAQPPFPWINPQYFIAAERYPELLASVPDLAQFRAFFGKQRKRVCLEFCRVERCILYCATCAYMRSDIFHSILLSLKEAASHHNPVRD